MQSTRTLLKVFTTDALNLLGLAIGILVVLLSGQISDPWANAINAIGVSLLVACFLTLWFRAISRITEGKKIAFFGEQIMKEEALLIYPDFVLSSEAQEALSKLHTQAYFSRPRSRYDSVVSHRNDLPDVVAANDVRALLYVAPLVAGWNGSGSRMIIDRRFLDFTDRSFISFGLSSNDLTHMYLEVDPKPLFSIVDDENGSEYLRVGETNYVSTETTQFGIVVRFRAKLDVYPEQVWFLVAGLGPIGTTAAAYFLSHQWQTLSKLAPDKEDFIAIISCGVGSENNGRLIDVVTRSKQS
ncbi:hypothetical protein [Auritidibacter ignavus]|uniref:hypothetical protein n=1 Tax=Auritidibacter ignavus TaxID=678932 RepID=UPI00109D3980|nr:hypothetical protein [Auritidibacter ignavus]